MGDGHGVLMQPSSAPFYLSRGEGNQPFVYLLAWCLASSLRSQMPPRNAESSDFCLVDLVARSDGPSFAKRKKGSKTLTKASPLDSVAGSQQDTDGEQSKGTVLPVLDDESASRCIALASRSSYGALSLTHKRLRELIRSGEIYDLRRGMGVVEQWVYMFASGDSSWKAFDPRQRKWMRLPPCLTDYAFIMSDKESLSAGTHLLWMGKEIANYVIFRYDLTTNSWSRGPPMNQARCLFASASCGKYAFVAGGNLDGTILSSVERYNSQRRKWERLPDMNTPRQKSSGCYMGGKFYVIGGRNSSHERVTSAEEYDPETRRWRVIENMFPAPAVRETIEPSPPLVAVVNNNLYCIDSSVNLLKAYDKDSNTWRTLGSVPVRADNHNGWGLAFKAVGDELYVIGGYRVPDVGEGMAMFSWRPGLGGGALNWNIVTALFAGSGSFLYNCAVMAC